MNDNTQETGRQGFHLTYGGGVLTAHDSTGGIRVWHKDDFQDIDGAYKLVTDYIAEQAEEIADLLVEQINFDQEAAS